MVAKETILQVDRVGYWGVKRAKTYLVDCPALF
jgi:hypothetical protein